MAVGRSPVTEDNIPLSPLLPCIQVKMQTHKFWYRYWYKYRCRSKYRFRYKYRCGCGRRYKYFYSYR
jgi:hypothetical protein